MNTRRVAITAGIFWGGALFLVTLANLLTGYGSAFLTWVVSIYPGFQPSPAGLIVGLIYGFLDGAIAVYVVSWVYRWVGRLV